MTEYDSDEQNGQTEEDDADDLEPARRSVVIAAKMRSGVERRARWVLWGILGIGTVATGLVAADPNIPPPKADQLTKIKCTVVPPGVSALCALSLILRHCKKAVADRALQDLFLNDPEGLRLALEDAYDGNPALEEEILSLADELHVRIETEFDDSETDELENDENDESEEFVSE